jgi:hypothetical protein
MWYSRWTRFPVPGTPGVAYPTQWDVRRLGRMYKRLTLLSANFDAAAPADSFAISDSLRAAFVAGPSNRPMWDLPMDSARILESRLARFGNPGQTQAAVKLGRSWLFLEGASVPQRNETDVQWLKTADPGSSVAGLLVTGPNTGRGGAAWFTQRKLPVYVTPGAATAMRMTLANWKQPPSGATVLSKPQWLRIGGDSVWVETIDLPDYPARSSPTSRRCGGCTAARPLRRSTSTWSSRVFASGAGRRIASARFVRSRSPFRHGPLRVRRTVVIPSRQPGCHPERSEGSSGCPLERLVIPSEARDPHPPGRGTS